MNKYIQTLALAGSLLVSSTVSADISNWLDDFEGYDNTEPTTLEPSYLVWGNVTGGAIGDYSYGPFPAPNNWDPGVSTNVGFSVLEPGEDAAGGVALSVYSDYNNTDHAFTGSSIESIFYKEYTIGAADVGKTWKFTFDAKLGLLAPPTTAEAFIRIIETDSGDFLIADFDSVNMTATPATWQGYTLSLTIDPAWVGYLFQIGMASTATNYDPSSIFYDNLFLLGGCDGNGTDTDGDGIDDNSDNCCIVSNATQIDTDGDGHGNACDADFQNNCLTNIFDLFDFKANFAGTDQEYDLDSTGGPVSVNIFDLFAFKGLFGSAPGPSPVGSLCNP